MRSRNPFLFAFILIGLTSYAQDPAFDDFERSGGPGPNWTIYFGGNNVTIIADSDLGLINGQQFGIAAWTGSTFSADQYCEAVISPDKIDSMWAQVFVRRRTSDAARYAFHWSDRDGVGGWYDIKYDGVPTPQTRLMASTLAPPPAPGDTLRVEVITNFVTGYPEIKGYHNGDLVVSAIDSLATAIMDGEPGMAFRFRLGWPATWPSKVFEEWNGGSLVGFTTAVIETNAGPATLVIAPNPACDQVLITYPVEVNSTGLLIATDALGHVVIERSLRLAKGVNRINVDVSDLAVGMFQLSIRTMNTAKSGRLVVTRP